MLTCFRKAFFFLALAALLGGVSLLPAWAQVEGFQDSFDYLALPGWEHSQDVTVENGALRIYPGNMALHGGDWQDIDLKLILRGNQPGETAIRYYFRDRSHYSLVLLPDMAVLLRLKDQVEARLGEAPVQNLYDGSWNEVFISVRGGNHSISLNGQPLLQVNDPEPLAGGALLLHRFGEGYIEFDAVNLNGQAAAPQERPQAELPPGEVPEAPGETFVEEPLPEAVLVTPQATPLPGGLPSWVQEFFSSQASQIELTTFGINLLLAVLAAFILGRVYIHWGASLSNRRAFAANFMLMTVTTTFIIMVVRSSVALSLGLVGALSIVRFRAAVKEPEELAYLFLTIGVGIGLGDNQRLLTLVTLVITIMVLGAMHLLRSSKADANLHLNIASRGESKLTLAQVMSSLELHTRKLKLLRLDENTEVMEASFLVEFRQLDDLNQATVALRNLSPGIEISFLDNKGIW
jgi:uncharacterized membrane protein YhiD involved in acid resistance